MTNDLLILSVKHISAGNRILLFLKLRKLQSKTSSGTAIIPAGGPWWEVEVEVTDRQHLENVNVSQTHTFSTMVTKTVNRGPEHCHC